ncbi:MAG: hypothetical protein QXR81_06805 [Candidatus Nezhaarchaeales archaeon]
MKRWGKKNCPLCYNYLPHPHPERLGKIPSASVVFVVGDGDIAFCDKPYLEEIVRRVKLHSDRCPYKTYYFQSKDWASSEKLIPLLEGVKNAVIIETLETNRDEGYSLISKAPPPTERHRKFVEVNHPRKVITAEPLLDFDVEPFFEMITEAEPELVWIGYNSRPGRVKLPEPSLSKTKTLIELLRKSGVEVRGKSLRGLQP